MVSFVCMACTCVRALDETTSILCNTSGDLIKLVEQERVIRSFSLDSTRKYVATASDDKFVKVWSLPSLELVASRYGTKQILFTFTLDFALA